MRALRACAGVVGAVALAFLLLASGFLACAAVPATTGALARANSEPLPGTYFSRDDLVSVALATRDYSFGSHDARALDLAIYDANADAAAARAAAGAGRAAGAPKLEGVDRSDGDAVAFALSQASDVYVYPADAVSHLDDCYGIAVRAYAACAVAAVAACACLVVAGMRGGRRRLGLALAAAGAIVIALLIALGLWAALDFDGLFASFHGLFFAQTGNWTFPDDSLLIRTLPEGFWMGMGGVWLAVSVALSAICIVAGTLLARSKRTAKR